MPVPRKQSNIISVMETLHLFNHLKGHKVYCNTVAGVEIEQTIDSVNHIPNQEFLTIVFESGKETQIILRLFDHFLEYGMVNYMSVKENVAMTLKDRE